MTIFIREGMAFTDVLGLFFLLRLLLFNTDGLGGEELDEWIAGRLTIGGIKLLLATALLRVIPGHCGFWFSCT